MDSKIVTDPTVAGALRASKSSVIDIFMPGDFSGAGWSTGMMARVFRDCPRVQDQLPYELSQHKTGLRMMYHKALDLVGSRRHPSTNGDGLRFGSSEFECTTNTT